MRPKYKVTGCARFFLFLVIFIPIVFFGAAFIRGENGVQIIKDYYHQVFGGDGTSTPKKDGDTGSNVKSGPEPKAEDTSDNRYELEVLKEELKKAQDEIVSLKAELKAKEKEIEALKNKK